MVQKRITFLIVLEFRYSAHILECSSNHRSIHFALTDECDVRNLADNLLRIKRTLHHSEDISCRTIKHNITGSLYFTCHVDHSAKSCLGQGK